MSGSRKVKLKEKFAEEAGKNENWIFTSRRFVVAEHLGPH